MVKAVASLIDFCYLVRRNVIDETALTQIQSTLDSFHQHREIFRDVGIRPDGFSLPRQHSLKHYVFSITQFGAPNGLCSSITESKHIKAVKRPYRRSGKNKPMGFMLVNNQRNHKLTAAHTFFASRGMLNDDGPSSVADLLGIHSGMYPKPSVSDLSLAHSQYGPPWTHTHVLPIPIPIKHPLMILRLVQRSGSQRRMVRITSFFSSLFLTKISTTYAPRPVFTCTKDPTT